MSEFQYFLIQLHNYLITNWTNLQFSTPAPSKLTPNIRPIFKGRAPDKCRQIVFWSLQDSKKPLLVTKWATSHFFSAFIKQEYQNASWLYRVRNCHFIPKYFAVADILGVPVLIEEAVEGDPVTEQIIKYPINANKHQNRVPTLYNTLFQIAKEFLTKIQDPLTPIKKKLHIQEWEPYIEKTGIVLGWDKSKAQKMKEIIEQYIPDPIPGTGETLIIGDFAPQNILMGSKGTFLIDLEFSRKTSMAFLDALSFIYTTFRLATNSSPLKDAEKTLQLFQKLILEKENSFNNIITNFLNCRGISQEYYNWYWLMYFIHETAFQHFLCGPFPPQITAYFDKQISILADKIKFK